MGRPQSGNRFKQGLLFLNILSPQLRGLMSKHQIPSLAAQRNANKLQKVKRKQEGQNVSLAVPGPGPGMPSFSRKALLNKLTMNCLPSTHLEPHEGDLTRGNVISTLGDGQTGDVVTVTVQEILLWSIYCLNEYGTAQGIKQMFLVRMAFEAIGNMS